MSVSYIDVNRLNSIDYDSENTNIWNYPIGSNINLPTGSQVSIQNSLINQKGILGDSIEIEEDITEEIRANVYVSEDFIPIPDQIPFAVKTNSYPFLNILGVHNRDDLFEIGTPQTYIDTIYNTGKSPTKFGGSQQPLILYEKTTDSGGQNVFTPVIIKKVFTIPKGVYGINQIADFITDQINGKKIVNNDGSISDINPIDAQIEAGTFKGSYSAGAGLTTTLNFGNEGIENFQDSENGTVTENHLKFPFLMNEHHVENINAFQGSKIETSVANWITANKFLAHLRDNQRGRYTSAPQNETPTEYLNVANFRLGRIGYTIGAPNFSLSFDSARNGFLIKNLHQPYRPPTIDHMGNAIANAGSECIGVRKPFGDGTTGTSNPFQNPPASGGDHSVTRSRILSCLTRPRSRISGAIIYNFAIRIAEQEGDVENVVSNASTGSAKFKDFFSSSAKAKLAWSKCIWSRLGFTYEQLNENKHREDVISYNKDTISRLEGITTNADFDMSINQSISNQVCPTTYIPQGSGAPVDNIQTFTFADTNDPKTAMANVYPDARVTLYNNIKSYIGAMTPNYSLIHVSTTDRPVVARNLPTLSKYGYYLITSNIIPSHNDIVQKSTNLPLLGVVPKSSLSNQDFISVDNQIVHTITNPISLNNIKIEVLNPDLTSAQLGSNSSVILKIVVPEDENA